MDVQSELHKPSVTTLSHMYSSGYPGSGIGNESISDMRSSAYSRVNRTPATIPAYMQTVAPATAYHQGIPPAGKYDYTLYRQQRRSAQQINVVESDAGMVVDVEEDETHQYHQQSMASQKQSRRPNWWRRIPIKCEQVV